MEKCITYYCKFHNSSNEQYRQKGINIIIRIKIIKMATKAKDIPVTQTKVQQKQQKPIVEPAKTQHKQQVKKQPKQQPKTQHHQQTPNKQQKEMRKIQQRQQMPTDKTELIQYLSERIKQAEQALNDTEDVLESEISERQKIAKSIQQRNSQLQKLYEVDQKGLPQKIKQKLTEILTQTINQKLQAQEQLKQEKSQNYEYKARYNQLKHQQNQYKSKLDELASKETELNKDITTRTQAVEKHQKEIKQLEEEFQSVKEKKEALEDKYLQMKVALERMNDLKSVLNRFFANEDLFDEKMDLKQQQVTRPQIVTELPQKPESRQPSRQNRTSAKLKPLNNSRKKDLVDDEDFWKGDFTAKTRNF